MNCKIFFLSIVAQLGVLPTVFAQSDVVQDKYLQYNPDGFVSEEKTTQSNGDVIMKRHNYVNDINPSTISCTSTAAVNGYKKLQALNKIDNPVENYTVVQKAGTSTEIVTEGELFIYSDNQPYPKARYALETAVPLSNFLPCGFSTSTCDLIYSSSYQLQETFDQYDVYGNLQQVTQKGGKQISFIYGYKGAYKTAVINNASTGQVAYSSFEGLDDHGYWSYNNSGILATDHVTGSSCYDLSSGAAGCWAYTSGYYIVSYWSKNGSASVSGVNVQNTHTGNTFNGWTYNEIQVRVTVQNSQPVHLLLTGTGQIDELRFYPASAHMETYTYTPLVGVSSTCDVKNMITNYEYDQLGRIVRIRDQAGNIVKKMDYGMQKSE